MIPTSPDETPTYLFNPSKEDFTWNFDGTPCVLPSRILVSFPKYLADHLARHLAQKLATTDDSPLAYEYRYQKWIDQIYVKLENDQP
jgi:hypothetical protein